MNDPWNAIYDQLQRHFHAATKSKCMLWVDPAQGDPFEGNSLVEDLRVRTPIRHPRFDPSRAPYIVPLDLSHNTELQLFRDSVELAWQSWSHESLIAMRGQPICGWVSTDESAKTLTAHWARRCHLHIQPGRAQFLRFQDPGVREWLWPVSTEAQQHALLGAASAIHAIGRAKQLTYHSRRDPRLSPAGVHPALQLTQAQWDQVDDYAVVHAAWLRFSTRQPAKTAAAQPANWEQPVFRALAQATRFGLRDSPDRELFAFHAIELGSEFHRHPQLAEVWRKTLSGEFYGSAIEEVIGCAADQLATFIRRSEGNNNEGRHG